MLDITHNQMKMQYDIITSKFCHNGLYHFNIKGYTFANYCSVCNH